jgi:membrane fusion protein, multidrug efflux system
MSQNLTRATKLKLVLLALGTALFLSCGSDAGSSQAASANKSAGTSTRGAQSAGPQTIDVTKVVSQKLSLTVRLPGEITPYESVAEFPKVTAFVKRIGVDRGSHVKAGEEIIRLEAPELVAQKQEAQSKLQAAEAQREEADAKFTADQSTFLRLKSAAATPGVVAGNDVEVAQQTTEADRARVRAAEQNIAAAKSALNAIAEIESYLKVTAPFDGVITERNVHPGALVGPNAGVPMVRIETISRLRLVLSLPENYVSGTVRGAKVTFTVSAYPGEKFFGTIARIPDSLDVKTRTMPVELDVLNKSGRLASGMYPEAEWPVQRPRPTLFVPASAIARTNEKRFVVRARDGKAEWVDVQTGLAVGNSIEVFGDIHEDDLVAVRGTDELRPGTALNAHIVQSK